MQEINKNHWFIHSKAEHLGQVTVSDDIFDFTTCLSGKGYSSSMRMLS